MYGQRTRPHRAAVRGGEKAPPLYCPPWLQLAMAYVPYQPLHPAKMSAEKALRKGTLFPDLYRPYEPRYRHHHPYAVRRSADA